MPGLLPIPEWVRNQEHNSELMRLSSLIKSMCSELVSMLCTVFV